MFSKAQQPQQMPSAKATTPFFKPEPTFKSLATEQQVATERAPESVMRLPMQMVQRTATSTDPHPTPATIALDNPRFTGNRRLTAIANGGNALNARDSREPVRLVQSALIDMGYALTRFRADGRMGNETNDAIRQFRTDRQIPGTEMDATAMQTLDDLAPAPNTQQRHFVDYDRLLADNQLDFAFGIGFDEVLGSHTENLTNMRAWLITNHFSLISSTPIGIEVYNKCQSLTFPDAQGEMQTRDIDINIKIITPAVGARQEFLAALNESEVTMYNGHARGGLGPDFDDIHTDTEQVVLGANSSLHDRRDTTVRTPRDRYWEHVAREDTNDFEQMARACTWDTEQYRVWFFSACTSLNYLDEIRGGLLPPNMTRHNLDVFGTTMSTPILGGIIPITSFIEGILSAQTMEQMAAIIQTDSLTELREQLIIRNPGHSERQIDRTIQSVYGNRTMFFVDGAADNQVAP